MTMMLIVVTSTVVWLIYATALVLWPVILANAIVLSLSLILIYFKLTFKKSVPEKAADK
jgi:MtN3 and saliva related transmembrane protein